MPGLVTGQPGSTARQKHTTLVGQQEAEARSLKPTPSLFSVVRKKNILLGFHVSITGSIDLAVDRAVESDCTAFQMFTRNPRGWQFKPLREEEAANFVSKRKKAGFAKVVVHMPYLPNLASPLKPLAKKSRESLATEVGRCGQLGVDYMVAHIGSHMGKGSMTGVRMVVEACNEALDANPKSGTMVLIENMAGQKNSVGARFEELRMILDGVGKKDRIGVCLDTCHAFAAGFDLSSKAGVETTLRLFDETVGLDRMKVVHLNDSKAPLGSNLDRHEHIGMGFIGEKGFRAFLAHDGTNGLPLLMETPRDERRTDAEELSVVRRLIGA
jgi:deoxyribonuclease IV